MNAFFILLKDNLLHTLKSRKTLIFLGLYVAVFGLIVHAINEAQRELFQRLAEQGGMNQMLYIQGYNFLFDLLEIESNAIVQKMATIPFYSIQLFAILLLGTPLLILMIYYDKLAQETSEGTFRYFLFRVSRARLYWAKFASMIIEVALLTLLATLLAILYGHFSLNFFQTSEILKWSLTYWLAGLTPLLTFASMVFMFSTLVKQPFFALLLSVVTLVGAAMMLGWIPELSPFYLDYWKGFFLPGTDFMLKSILIYLIFMTTCALVGFFIFKKRDL